MGINGVKLTERIVSPLYAACMVLMLAVIVPCQTSQPSGYDALAADVSADSGVKAIAAATSKAKRQFETTQRSLKNDPEKLARVYIEFAEFRVRMLRLLIERRAKHLATNDDAQEFYDLYYDSGAQIENLLTKAVDLYEKDLKTQSAELGAAKFRLAWLIENFQPRSFSPSSFASKQKLVIKEQELYRQALEIQEKYLGRANADSLVTRLLLANSYFKAANFESAVPLLEDYIAIVSDADGNNSLALVPALKSLISFSDAVGDVNTETKLVSRLAQIDPKIPGDDRSYLVLTGRAVASTSGKNETRGAMNVGTGVDGSSVTIAGKASIASGLPVVVEVDENGVVTRADAQSQDPKLKKKIDQTVLSWKFRPLIYREKPSPIRGIIYYWVMQ